MKLPDNFAPTASLRALLVDYDAPFIHRDLSWLQFNERVLAEAQDVSTPPLERLKFLSITASNLDEFFMIRLASFMRSVQGAQRASLKDGGASLGTSERLTKIRETLFTRLSAFSHQQQEVLIGLQADLKKHRIELVLNSVSEVMGEEIESEVLTRGGAIFDDKVLPHLGHLEVFSPAHLSGLLNLQSAVLLSPNSWIRVPKGLPGTYVSLNEKEGRAWVFFLDDLLRAHLKKMFQFEGTPTFIRLTRDGDFTAEIEEEDSESVPDIIRTSIGSRDQGRPLRLQIQGGKQGDVEQWRHALRLDQDQVFAVPGSLFLHGLWSAASQIPGLKYPPLRSRIPQPLRDVTPPFDRIFAVLEKRDFLLHHPYDSFDAFVNWIQVACQDPEVTMIEQTVYRMDTLSPMIAAMKEAAKTKRVRVLIELRARFDELNNLKLAEELRTAGVEVAFGFGKLKLHAKIALITRVSKGVEKRYAHLSTGNYNATTARQYTDLGILSANPELCQDARTFFDALWREEVPSNFRKLVSAPGKLHRRLISLIESEIRASLAGKKARIVAKVNALVDQAVIESLYRASQAGVEVDLIVRGACSLIPGVKGLSEKIRVISIVDRLLEHSRIYYFENSRAIYLSSADWMPRNFFSRIELAFPILDEYIYKYIEEVMIPAYLNDRVKAREMKSDGTWTHRRSPKGIASVRSQEFFEELAWHEYKGTPLQ